MKITNAGLDAGFLNRSNILEALMQSHFCGVLAFDTEFRYRLWSPVMELISGMTAREVMGQNAFDVFPFLKHTNEYALFVEAVEGRVSQSREIPFEVPTTGRKGYFDGNYQPLFDDDGKVVGGISTVRDVTEEVLQRRFLAVLTRESTSAPEQERVIVAADQLASSLGQVILRRRKLMDMSQEELACRAEIHRTYLGDIEHGKRNMSVKSMVRIAQALGVSASALFGVAESGAGERDK